MFKRLEQRLGEQVEAILESQVRCRVKRFSDDVLPA